MVNQVSEDRVVMVCSGGDRVDVIGIRDCDGRSRNLGGGQIRDGFASASHSIP